MARARLQDKGGGVRQGKEAFETAAGRKREIKESMTLLVLSSERRKEKN